MSNYTTLREYAQALNELMKSDPDAGDLPVYYHGDDEGNGMNRVSYLPEIYYMVDDGSDTRTVEGEDMLDYERDGHSVTRCVIIN